MIIQTQDQVHKRKDVICTPEREWQFEDGIEYNVDFSVVLTNCPADVSFLQITEEFFMTAHIYADCEQYGTSPGTWLLCLETAAERNAALAHQWSFPTTAIALRNYNGQSSQLYM